MTEIDTIIQRLKESKEQSVNLSYRGLMVAPSKLGEVKNCTKLYLSNNELTVPPEEIGSLQSSSEELASLLVSIILRYSNCASDIEGLLFSKGFLEEVAIDHNKLTLLPTSLFKLPHLQYLNASFNNISFIPDDIHNLCKLKQLWLNSCSLTQIPKALCMLTALEKLSLKNNTLHCLPHDFGKLANLKWLNLADNQLETLPQSMSSLTKLTFIDVQSNRLTEIPECISELNTLTMLIVRRNPIRNVPDDVVLGLSGLSKFDLRETNVSRRPSHWKGLEHILISSESAELLSDNGTLTIRNSGTDDDSEHEYIFE